MTQHNVHDVELTDGEHETEELEPEELEGEAVKPLGVVGDEGGQASDLLCHGDFCQRILVDLFYQLGDPSSLLVLPSRPWDITDTGLDHQQQTHPLIVVVMRGSILGPHGAIVTSIDSRLGVAVEGGVGVGVAEGVGAPHEAEGLEQVLGNLAGAQHAVDVVAKELSGGCQC